jgi:hypothetical protein
MSLTMPIPSGRRWGRCWQTCRRRPTAHGPLDQSLHDYIMLITILATFLEVTALQVRQVRQQVFMGMSGVVHSGLATQIPIQAWGSNLHGLMPGQSLFAKVVLAHRFCSLTHVFSCREYLKIFWVMQPSFGEWNDVIDVILDAS